MLLLSLLHVASRAQRVATPHEVQPGPRDVVHAVWPFGPTNTEKLGGGWPSFTSSAGSGDASAQCTVVDDGFTGYNANGAYCQKSSGELDSKAQLMIYSGRLGIVVDVGGLKADASTKSRNLFPRVAPSLQYHLAGKRLRTLTRSGNRHHTENYVWIRSKNLRIGTPDAASSRLVS